MGGIKLRFTHPAAQIKGGPVRLVFGEQSSQVIEPVAAEGSGHLTGMGGFAVVRTVAVASINSPLSAAGGSAKLTWNANVSRSTCVEVQSKWQQAQPVSVGISEHWQQSLPSGAMLRSRWQEGAPLRGSVHSSWRESERVRGSIRGGWQQGTSIRGAAQAVWQEAERLRAGVRGVWQQGTPIRGAARTVWQETLRLRHAIRAEWSEAVPVRVLLSNSYGDGQPVRVGLRPHWQEAMRPKPGTSIVKPPIKHSCYVPSLPVRLVFRDQAVSGIPIRLIFKCDGHGTTRPPAVIVVQGRRTYIVINSIEVRRADSPASEPLPCETFSMQLDRQSWTWRFNAAFHASARDAVSPSLTGVPVELEVRVNGQPFRLQAERIGKSRKLPERLVTVSGRGKAALLDAPHSVVQTFSHSMTIAAQQLAGEVLNVNGGNFGWSLDWNIVDWQVPAHTWMFQGTYAAALADIVGAAGGYLQPHDTDPILRVLPAWPQPWWRFDQLTPDFDLPEGIGEVEDTEVIYQPMYDRMFVSGETGGGLFDIYRAGFPGTVLKQMEVHPLITQLEVAQARAVAELSESGTALKHKVTLPVLPETGVIKPGHILRYVDEDSVTRTGIVRSTNIAHQFPVLTQSLEIDSHV